MNKYEMIECENLFRIRALRDVGDDVKKGDLGGLIENEGNLSQEGRSWIYEGASAQGDAEVSGDACISGNAVISGSAMVSGNAMVSGDARVTDNARVFGNARVSGDARVTEFALVMGDARVLDSACISGNARITDNAWVIDNAAVSGRARVSDSAVVSEFAIVSGDAYVHGNARVNGNAYVHGDAHLAEEIIVKSGEYVEDLTNNRNYLSLLRNEFSVSPVKDVVILYKKVNSTSAKGVYTSWFDPDFIYEVGKTAVAEKIDVRMISCANGLHVSTPDYWHVGDTLIAVEINVKDIITIQDGKIRVSKLKVVEECAKIIEEKFMNALYSLQDIKNNYYQALSWGMIEHMGLNEYIKEYYIQTYDINLNFLGYEETPGV